MDVSVAPAPEEAAWILTDLLGRPMGRVREEPGGSFRVVAAGLARETLKTMKLGPFHSLDAALAEIERFTRSRCRRVPQKRGTGRPTAKDES